MPVDIKTSGVHRIISVLRRLSRANDARLHRKVGRLVAKQHRSRFETKRSPAGVRWKAWSPEYKKTRSSGKSLLNDSGALKESIQQRMASQVLQVGSEVEYALPVNAARPFIGMSSQDENEVMDTIASHVQGLLSGGPGGR